MLSHRIFATAVLIVFLALPGVVAQTLTAVDALAVYDGSGQRVGAAQASDDDVRVLFQVEGIIFAVEVRDNKIVGTAAAGYESADCSGQPWFPQYDDQIMGRSFVFEGSGTTLLEDRAASPQAIDLASIRYDGDGVCDEYGIAVSAVPALEFPNLLAQFTPPYRLRDETQRQGSGAGFLSFPTVLRGGGASSRVLVGAGDTALSVEASFSAPDGTLLESRSISVLPNGVSSVDFVGANLEFGSLGLAVDPSDGHILSTEVISLPGAPPLGVPPSPLCTNPEYLVVQSNENRTAGAFANPSSTEAVSCDWVVLTAEGASVGGGSIELPPQGQEQFFPDERINLPAEFLGSFRADCDGRVHVFSLFQKSDGTLTSNAADCGEQ